MKLLIIKTSTLGDIVQALPVLDYLHCASPGCEIDWVVNEDYQEILTGNPVLSRIIPIRSALWRKRPFSVKTIGEIRTLRLELRARQYDMVFDLQGSLKSGLIAWLTDVATVIGHTREALSDVANLWFTTRQVPMRREDRHDADRDLRLVSVPFGRDYRDMTLVPYIFTNPESEIEAEALLATLSDGLVFLCYYGAGWQTYLWSADGWVSLGKRILARFPDATLLFPWETDYERREVVEITSRIGLGARAIGQYDLKGLAAIAKKVDMVIGPDAAPVHMAVVVGTPTVSFYRASEAMRRAPRGEGHVAVQSPLSCHGCELAVCDRDVECRDSISVDVLFSAVEKLLGK